MRNQLLLVMLAATAFGYAGDLIAQAADPFPNCAELGIAGPADIGRAQDKIAKFGALGCKDARGKLFIFPPHQESQAIPPSYAPAPPKADSEPYTSPIFRFSGSMQF